MENNVLAVVAGYEITEAEKSVEKFQKLKLKLLPTGKTAMSSRETSAVAAPIWLSAKMENNWHSSITVMFM